MADHPAEGTPVEPAAPIGIVLAGGRSRRLGRDKTRLEIDGRTLPRRAVERLRGVCGTIALADAGRHLLDGIESIQDLPAGGPASGILGAAQRFPGRPLLVLACDLPHIPTTLLAELAIPGRPVDWVVPRWRRGIEPLCALYGPAALARLESQAAAGNPALHRLAEATDLRIHWLRDEALERHGRPAEIFLNVNTPDDLLSLGDGLR